MTPMPLYVAVYAEATRLPVHQTDAAPTALPEVKAGWAATWWYTVPGDSPVWQRVGTVPQRDSPEWRVAVEDGLVFKHDARIEIEPPTLTRSIAPDEILVGIETDAIFAEGHAPTVAAALEAAVKQMMEAPNG